MKEITSRTEGGSHPDLTAEEANKEVHKTLPDSKFSNLVRYNKFLERHTL